MDACSWYLPGKGGNDQLLVRRMQLNEARAAMNLQKRVWAHMPNPALLAETSLDEIRESMVEDVCLGVFDGERLAAFSLMVINRASENRNGGQKNGYPPRECVTFDTVFVDPEYLGLGLQRKLFSIQEEMAAQLQVRGCDISRVGLGHIECGHRSTSVFEIDKIVEVLGVDYNALFAQEETKED